MCEQVLLTTRPVDLLQKTRKTSVSCFMCSSIYRIVTTGFLRSPFGNVKVNKIQQNLHFRYLRSDSSQQSHSPLWSIARHSFFSRTSVLCCLKSFMENTTKFIFIILLFIISVPPSSKRPTDWYQSAVRGLGDRCFKLF